VIFSSNIIKTPKSLRDEAERKKVFKKEKKKEKRKKEKEEKEKLQESLQIKGRSIF
jgi:hypothetical protein